MLGMCVRTYVYNLQPLSCVCCLFSWFCLGCSALGSGQLLFHYFTKYASDAIHTYVLASFLSKGNPTSESSCVDLLWSTLEQCIP